MAVDFQRSPSPGGPKFDRDTKLAIVGTGRVGISLGVLLKRSGCRITGAVARSTGSLSRAAEILGSLSSTSMAEAVSGAEAIAICVPDDDVEEVARDLSPHVGAGTFCFHTAGSRGVSPLGHLAERGAHVLAIHPLQAVPDHETGVERLPGSYFGVTCSMEVEAWAAGLVEAVGGKPVWVSEEERPRYHAAAVIASNYLVALGLLAEQVGGEIVPYLPLMAGTLANLERLGPREALTGPLVRGDVGTVDSHLALLDGEASSAYRALARFILVSIDSLAPEVVQELHQKLEGS